jgi:hypothetical protein
LNDDRTLSRGSCFFIWDESNFGDDGEGGAALEETRPVSVVKTENHFEKYESESVLISALAGVADQTVEPPKPRSASDYSGFWMTVVRSWPRPARTSL